MPRRYFSSHARQAIDEFRDFRVPNQFVAHDLHARWIRPRIWVWRKCHVTEGSICEFVEPPAA